MGSFRLSCGGVRLYIQASKRPSRRGQKDRITGACTVGCDYDGMQRRLSNIYKYYIAYTLVTRQIEDNKRARKAIEQ